MNPIPTRLESAEVVSADITLAYASLARHLTAIATLLEVATWPGEHEPTLRRKVEQALAVIHAVEHPCLVVRTPGAPGDS